LLDEMIARRTHVSYHKEQVLNGTRRPVDVPLRKWIEQPDPRGVSWRKRKSLTVWSMSILNPTFSA